MLSEIQGSLWSGILGALAWLFLVFLFYLIRSPLFFKNEELLKNRAFIIKIDDDDLKHILNGYIYENIFFYKHEHVGCKPYQIRGKYDFERLKDGIDIFVPAPKNSLVQIQFYDFVNYDRNGKIDFYIITENNKPILIDIYEQQSILLDSKSSFTLKIKLSEGYDISEHMNLGIKIESWTKQLLTMRKKWVTYPGKKLWRL